MSSKVAKVQVMVLVLMLIACAYGLFVLISWGESKTNLIEAAYERGKIDGQLLELKLQSSYDEETIDLYIDCIHLLNLSKFGLISVDSTYYVLTLLYDKDSLLVDIWGQKIKVDQIDSTDTMPAVERDTIWYEDTVEVRGD